MKNHLEVKFLGTRFSRRQKLFAGEEGRYHRDYNQGNYEANDDQASTSFYIVHEFVVARAQYQGVRRSTNGGCKCAGSCNCNSHQNCLRVSAQVLRNSDTDDQAEQTNEAEQYPRLVKQFQHQIDILREPKP